MGLISFLTVTPQSPDMLVDREVAHPALECVRSTGEPAAPSVEDSAIIHTSPDGTTCGSRSHPRPRIAIGDLSHGERYSNVEDEIGARLAVASAALPCVPSVICVWHWKVMCDALSPRISTAHVNTISPDDPGTSYTHAGLHLAASTGEAPTSERVH